MQRNNRTNIEAIKSIEKYENWNQDRKSEKQASKNKRKVKMWSKKLKIKWQIGEKSMFKVQRSEKARPQL